MEDIKSGELLGGSSLLLRPFLGEEIISLEISIKLPV
jgi:hypothetical protein